MQGAQIIMGSRNVTPSILPPPIQGAKIIMDKGGGWRALFRGNAVNVMRRWGHNVGGLRSVIWICTPRRPLYPRSPPLIEV